MKLEPKDFVKMFGGPLDLKTFSEIKNYDWSYKPISVEDFRLVVNDLLTRVERRDFSIAGENTGRWQKGWQENLDEFRRTGEISALEPKYLRPSKFLQLSSHFIMPRDPMFERNFWHVMRGWFARTYLSEFDCIYEFGCGSCHNIAFLRQEFPDKMILGFDWADASCEIIDELQTLHPDHISGGHFDFFNPSAWFEKFAPNSAALTVGALEQTGTRWRPFVDFLRRAQPAMCFHIEPMIGLYEPSNLVDRTAIEIHKARGFWTSFCDVVHPSLHRTGFGSLLLEGYSQAIWNPAFVEQARVDALEGAP